MNGGNESALAAFTNHMAKQHMESYAEDKLNLNTCHYLGQWVTT